MIAHRLPNGVDLCLAPETRSIRPPLHYCWTYEEEEGARTDVWNISRCRRSLNLTALITWVCFLKGMVWHLLCHLKLAAMGGMQSFETRDDWTVSYSESIWNVFILEGWIGYLEPHHLFLWRRNGIVHQARIRVRGPADYVLDDSCMAQMSGWADPHR